MASAQSSFNCTEQGTFADSDSCHNYYTCDENLIATPGICMDGHGTYLDELKGCILKPCVGPSDFICTDAGLYIDPNNCSNFYVCDDDLTPTLGTCPGDEGGFNNATKMCSDKSCFHCPTPGFFADPDDCHSFYICNENLVANHSTCTQYAHFDPVSICVLGDCGTICRSLGIFADPEDCHGFYICDENLNPTHQECFGGSGHFDIEQGGCLEEDCQN